MEESLLLPFGRRSTYNITWLLFNLLIKAGDLSRESGHPSTFREDSRFNPLAPNFSRF